MESNEIFARYREVRFSNNNVATNMNVFWSGDPAVNCMNLLNKVNCFVKLCYLKPVQLQDIYGLFFVAGRTASQHLSTSFQYVSPYF